jgi:hypothetical protein
MQKTLCSACVIVLEFQAWKLTKGQRHFFNVQHVLELLNLELRNSNKGQGTLFYTWLFLNVLRMG